MDMLRFATAGLVDDGKSTLIGGLLFDSKPIFEDQFERMEATSKSRGDEYVDLALLRDGLRAECEQGITIDVAYRHFATPNRKFINADMLGHAQHSHNMVMGASTADLAIVLVNARKGVLKQSRRHTTIASLLRVPQIVLTVNKMDLVDWSQEVFESISDEFFAFASKLNITDMKAIPLSALLRNNVVHRSEIRPWYEGASLMHHLENVYIASDRKLQDVRFPVHVIRPQQSNHRDYRGYAGEVASGVMKVGDEVLVLPSGPTSKIVGIDTADGPPDEAFPPMCGTVRLADELDISRGDVICRKGNHPEVSQDIDAMVCWMDGVPLAVGQRLSILDSTREARAIVKEIAYELDVNTLHRRESAHEFGLNSIARVKLRTTTPLVADEYARNRTMGSILLVGYPCNRKIGAGTISTTE